MKLLLTYFWKTLPIGASIWLAPIWLISPNRATHLKSPKNDLMRESNILLTAGKICTGFFAFRFCCFCAHSVQDSVFLSSVNIIFALPGGILPASLVVSRHFSSTKDSLTFVRLQCPSNRCVWFGFGWKTEVYLNPPMANRWYRWSVRCVWFLIFLCRTDLERVTNRFMVRDRSPQANTQIRQRMFSSCGRERGQWQTWTGSTLGQGGALELGWKPRSNARVKCCSGQRPNNKLQKSVIGSCTVLKKMDLLVFKTGCAFTRRGKLTMTDAMRCLFVKLCTFWNHTQMLSFPNEQDLLKCISHISAAVHSSCKAVTVSCTCVEDRPPLPKHKIAWKPHYVLFVTMCIFHFLSVDFANVTKPAVRWNHKRNSLCYFSQQWRINQGHTSMWWNDKFSHAFWHSERHQHAWKIHDLFIVCEKWSLFLWVSVWWWDTPKCSWTIVIREIKHDVFFHARRIRVAST